MFKRISYSVLLLLLTLSCSRDLLETDVPQEPALLPEGVPVTLILPFSSKEMLDVDVRTKAEASRIDESRIHDLYVMIFDNDDLIDDPELGITDSPKRIYGRYFSYDHLESSLSDMEANDNECWFVENKDIGGTVSQTTGAVKVSTITRTNATLVVIANVENAVTNMDGQDELDRLRAVRHLKELKGIEVCLEQDVVNRKDLFLMTGSLDVNTRLMNWGSLPKDYDSDYTVTLTPVDAKVKFRVKVNKDNISAVTPVYWQVLNTPDRCFLDSSHNGQRPPESTYYFKSQKYYFEGSETIGGDTYYTFCFYILENRLACNKSATNYYQREIRKKNLTDEESDKLKDAAGEGYDGTYEEEAGQYFVTNGDWEYAPSHGSYVQFDLVLTLTEEGIADMGSIDTEGLTIGQALTSDAIFTVHLGDFTSSAKPDGWSGFDNYRTERGNCYTYTITVNNTKSIYTEVALDKEVQAGQEGFLLLTDAEIINADCHYEYHQIYFEYRPEMTQDKFSWYVKTPFGEGGPDIIPLEDAFGNPNGEYAYEADGGTYTVGGIEKTGPKLDYRWVKFGINDVEGGKYTVNRHKYPGDGHYDPSWHPGAKVDGSVACNDPGRDLPDLMDITQLIEYIFYETNIETRHRENGSNPESAFLADDSDPLLTAPVIRFTAFIDEFYYEHNPLEEEVKVDPELWRKFVNAQPREMHILSDARQSRDRCSDVILSSHSIIQQSIQTIYNIHATSLHTIWGTEHQDEMREKSSGWPYWPGDDPSGRTVSGGRSGRFDTDLGKWNGRLNSAWIWDFYDSQYAGGNDRTNKEWDTFLDYNVDNDTPELKAAYQGMAYSCLSRNRDNDGDGKVDRNEVRWYLAAADQLVGMWIGNEALSINARLYRPAEGQWRAHIISSSGKKVCWAEEGGGATDYTWDFESGRYTWDSVGEAAAGESVRCLRNIGTYDDGGTLKDISESPYSQDIDTYFSLTDKGDGSYSFLFDRISPKSIREMSEGELPYHDQFNIANSVYLQFETQKKSGNVGDDGSISKKLQDINPEVTALGYNPYCPTGYRFPNQSEMVLMSLYLPADYMKTSKDDVEYPGTLIPTRTYFDRGMYGTVRTGMSDDEIAQEAGGTNSAGTTFVGKVGWVYDTSKSKQSCMRGNQDVKRFRCVRDVPMTGYIEGGIMMKSDQVYPNDPVALSLNFFSSGAAFVSAALQLCYTDNEGNYHERDLPVNSMPSGLEYLYEQKVTIPTLATLGLDSDDLDTDLKNMSFKITLRNAAGTRVFRKDIVLCNPLEINVEATEIYPDDHMSLDLSTHASSSRLASATVEIYGDNPADVHKTTSNISLSGKRTATELLYIPGLEALSPLSGFSDVGDNLSIRVTLTDDGGCTVTKTIQRPVVSHLNGGGVEFPNAFDADNGVPVRPAVVSATNVASVTAESLWWKESGAGSYTEIALTSSQIAALNAGTAVDFWMKDILGASWDTPANRKKEYLFYITATCSDGTSYTSPVRSMELIRFNECDNPVPEGGWTNYALTNNGQAFKGKWSVQTISSMDFSRGDYLEADIDVTQCYYIMYGASQNNDNDFGMDNLITIGTSADLNWKNGDIYFYYPAHNPAEAPGLDRMQVSIKDNNNTVTRLRPYDLSGSLFVKLSKDLMLINGDELDYSAVMSGSNSASSNSNTRSRETIAYITNQTSIKLGSVEGKHRSRATYRYVRVIRNLPTP